MLEGSQQLENRYLHNAVFVKKTLEKIVFCRSNEIRRIFVRIIQMIFTRKIINHTRKVLGLLNECEGFAFKKHPSHHITLWKNMYLMNMKINYFSFC